MSLNVSVLMSDMYCMYVCMRVCTKSFLKTTTNSLCACAHLANKAYSDSDSDLVFLHLYSVNLITKIAFCYFILLSQDITLEDNCNHFFFFFFTKLYADFLKCYLEKNKNIFFFWKNCFIYHITSGIII